MAKLAPDPVKLARLRDDHAALQAAYRSASGRHREALAALVAARADATTDWASERQAAALALPSDALAALPAEELKAAKITPATVARIVAAASRVERLRDEAAILAQEFRASAAIMARVEDYARAKGL